MASLRVATRLPIPSITIALIATSLHISGLVRTLASDQPGRLLEAVEASFLCLGPIAPFVRSSSQPLTGSQDVAQGECCGAMDASHQRRGRSCRGGFNHIKAARKIEFH